MTIEASGPAFLSLPPELRNQIYHLLYVPQDYTPSTTKRPIKPLELSSFGRDTSYDDVQTTTKNNANLLRVCKQIHNETHLLYWDTSLFHVTGAYAEPKAFDSIVSAIPRSRQSAIKHIVLTAKLNHLRCLNEQWNSVPFGNDCLSLDTLTIIPIRPEIHGNLYEEVVDLNQSHTIAHVLTETLKSLRNVRVVVLRNEGCYKPVVWKLLYSGLVYRLWRWGGRLCGLGFRELVSGDGFEILSGDAHEELKARRLKQECLDEADLGWKDIEEEMDRLMGVQDNGEGRVEPRQPGWNVA